jgi:hypothetical protein
MRPTSERILEDSKRIQDTIRIAGDNALDDNGKRALSEMIAYYCYEIRRKYELTSQYFFIAECSAHKKYDEEYDKE